MSYYRNNKQFLDVSIKRLHIIGFFVLIFGIGIIIRLFFLQIIEHNKFEIIAKNQHTSGIKIPPKRGEILAKDKNTGTFYKLATNITLDLLYIDPQVIPDEEKVSEIIAPYVFNKNDYKLCIETPETCPIDKTKHYDTGTDEPENHNTKQNGSSDEDNEATEDHIIPYEEYLKIVKKNILDKISIKEITYLILKKDVPEDKLKKIDNFNISGIIVDYKNNLVAVNPVLIPQKSITKISKVLDSYLGLHYSVLKRKLQRQKIRYVPLKNKLSKEESDQIKALKETDKKLFKGIVLLPEHWRSYPNGSLAAQVLGFLSNENGGQYGIEEQFDTELMGKQGRILADTDPDGNTIGFGDEDIENVINGKDIILTINLPIQKKVEEILEKNTKKYNARSAQVVIMDPFTGSIIAMANYPSFDPNNYGKVFEMEKLPKWEQVPEYIPVFIKDKEGKYIKADKKEHNLYEIDRYIYKNLIGPESFSNKTIQDIYEPGSVFKPIAMAIALDVGEVTPQTKYNDDGPLKTGEFLGEKEIEIHNAKDKIYGWVTMTQCLEDSINTCMAFVAQKLGKQHYAPVFYKYIKRFGFDNYTDIELIYEEKGKITEDQYWTKTELITKSFGQGIAATPLQVVTAWAALANGGVLVRPHIIDSIIDTNGNIERFEPESYRTVIKKDTSSTITAMLISSVNNGVANPAKIDKYLLAGKTGTSQIAKENGTGYEEGEGAHITSFAGYAPVHHPKFVMLVKFDRPRYGSDSTWGSTTAAPTFKEISEFLFKYYNIEPDDI